MDFDAAVKLFLKPPQTKLVRHLCASMLVDPTYATRNLVSITRVVKEILKTQGIDPDRALGGGSPLPLIREAARRLRIKTNDSWYTAA